MPGKFIPAHQFTANREIKLPESIMVQTVTGEYTDDHWDFVEPPIPTCCCGPMLHAVWSLGHESPPVRSLLIVTRLTESLTRCRRNVLRYVLGLYEEAGLKPVVAPRSSFTWLTKTDPDYELMPPKGRSGRREVACLSYSIDAVAEFEDFVEDMYDFADQQQLDVDTLIHETAPRSWRLILITATAGDGRPGLCFQRTVRETAQRYNMYATFMAKPMQREPGSALHIHQSVIDLEMGKNCLPRRG